MIHFNRQLNCNLEVLEIIFDNFEFYKIFFFNLDAPPTLLYSFIEQTIQPGPAVSLKCSASGNPTPQMKWNLDGFELPGNGR